MRIPEDLINKAEKAYASKRHPARWDGETWGEAGQLNHRAAIKEVLKLAVTNSVKTSIEQYKILNTLRKCLPYSDQMFGVDLFEDGSIRFDWRGRRYRISRNYGVEQVGDGILISSNKAMLIQALLENERNKTIHTD